MAVYLGYRADAWVHPNQTIDPLGEKTWLGHMTMYNRPVADSHPHTRMIAVAGMIAETLWKNGHDEEYLDPWGWECYLLDEDSMSPSDWRLAGCEPGEPDDDLFHIASEVAELLMTELWSGLTGIARTLMSDTEAIHSFSYGDPVAQAA